MEKKLWLKLSRQQLVHNDINRANVFLKFKSKYFEKKEEYILNNDHHSLTLVVHKRCTRSI